MTMDRKVLSFSDSYEYITFDDSLKLTECQHVAHCAIYTPYKLPRVGPETKAWVSMQVRFDGRLGFPGGIIDEEGYHGIVEGLNRELYEEINLEEKYHVTQKDYCFSHTNKEKTLCMHFFKKEVSLQEFRDIEKNSLDAEEWGKEVLGLLRVPLITMHDGIGGFPAFLSNKFAGNAKYQLLQFLVDNGLLLLEDAKEIITDLHL